MTPEAARPIAPLSLMPFERIEAAQMQARDGTSLVMDIWLPRGGLAAGPYPVVVERTPYGRNNPRLQRYAEVLAARGMAVVLQDVRGRGASGGRFHLMMNIPDEGQDGADTLAWVCDQAWCDGRIGTMGLSFTAANQHAAALHHPKGLKAQVQFDSGTNYFRRMFRHHGAANIGVALPWILTFGQEVAPDAGASEAIRTMRQSVPDWIEDLPLKRGETAIARIPEYENIYFTILESSDLSDYWRNPTIYLEGRWDEYPTDLSLLLVSGWFSHHCRANLDKFTNLDPRLTGALHLVLGPWVHGEPMPETLTAGDADFGPAAAAFGPGERLRADWFEKYLLGDAPSATREIHYFLMGTGNGHVTPEGRIFHGGEWRSSEVWPLKGTTFQPFYLNSGQKLSVAAPKADQPPSHYTFDPDDPCPGIGGVNIAVDHMPDFILPGPRLQVNRPSFVASRGSSSPLAERSDVLVFETEPLAQPLEVTGPISCRLFVSSSAPDTDFHVRLIDQYPATKDRPACDLLISEGILRMRHRDNRDIGELIEPGSVYEVTVELGATSNRFKAGHRIAIHVTSSCFPQYDVNPNTGEPLGRHTYKQLARQTVFHDALRPSALILPVQEAI